ncbi:serine hydrolase domain-containing protein [Xenorhabdus griffiniae]|uniref:Serine hydrolase domain-containing protein n=1 Tax=Xenorhabdus griffiniae TaxID=351672 RepID=A0ABY9XCQ1_9GAMM|nr:serine hydrolase domain-containing protein [Xenorhabdus griffiniae]MBD1226417.1 beta-lactamase family protein [Xenorhabdus griffiniae]MBE8589141.1 beta-lactamase family protein [Xenorhabdus griffiniae]WMV70643.1 serine hydrolase domain-containing protein [Xenorhabdus griffiniae]WNH00320.1 serine hydrolase domain-containing protein [Xenorhabdus griffiniae]
MNKNPEIIKALDELLTSFDKHAPGVVYMAKYDNGLTYQGSIGLACLESHKPLSIESVFNIASVSKQFTAFTLLLLENDGYLSLDDSITKFLPDLGSHAKPVTLRHLIYHTGGLVDYMELAESIGINEQDPLTIEQSLHHLYAHSQSVFAPGTTFEYSNTGYFLLAQVAEKASGIKLSEFSQERIFKPLGMKNTFIVDEYPIIVEFARAYNPKGQLFESPWTHTGDGAVHSTVGDLMLWGENLSHGRVGGISLVQRMTQALSKITSTGDMVKNYETYAFGLEHHNHLAEPSLEHSGEWAGYRAHFIRLPNSCLTIAALSNQVAIDTQELSYKVADILLKAA